MPASSPAAAARREFMLLSQAITEVRAPQQLLPNDQRLLTPAGRETPARLSRRHAPRGVRRQPRVRHPPGALLRAGASTCAVAIRGADEAWRVAPELAAAGVAVILDPLDDLPAELRHGRRHARERRAPASARASRSPSASTTREPHNIRKLRQGAGVAVAHGLPWEAALAALTRNPAEIFGVADRNGSIERGRPADLVLWSGDPLEVTSARRRGVHPGRGTADALAADGTSRPLPAEAPRARRALKKEGSPHADSRSSSAPVTRPGGAAARPQPPALLAAQTRPAPTTASCPRRSRAEHPDKIEVIGVLLLRLPALRRVLPACVHDLAADAAARTWCSGACRSASTARRGSTSRAPSTRCRSLGDCSTSSTVRCSTPSTRSTQQLLDEDSIADWVGKNGGNADKFAAAYSSFGVNNQTVQADAMAEDYGVDERADAGGRRPLRGAWQQLPGNTREHRRTGRQGARRARGGTQAGSQEGQVGPQPSARLSSSSSRPSGTRSPRAKWMPSPCRRRARRWCAPFSSPRSP